MVLNHAAERIETGDLQYRIRRGMTDFLSLGARVTGKSETLRKSIHLGTLIFVLFYMKMPKQTILWIYGALLLVSLIVELLRLSRSDFREWFERNTGPLLRSHERKRLTGATYLFLSSFLTVLLFDRWIAITALLFVVVSDALGGLVGRRWGKHKLWGDRSVEGTLAFLFSAVLFIIVNPYIPFIIGAFGVLIALSVEIFMRSLDDNLTIPLCSGITMQLLVLIHRTII